MYDNIILDYDYKFRKKLNIKVIKSVGYIANL